MSCEAAFVPFALRRPRYRETSTSCVSRCSAVSGARRRLLRALLHVGGVLPALLQSPTRDAAFFQLYPSPVRRSERSESACGTVMRSSRCLKFLLIVLEVSAILACFAFFDTCKRTTVGRSVSHINIWENIPSCSQGLARSRSPIRS